MAPFSGTPSAAADTAGAVGPAAGAGGWGAAAGSAAGTTKSVLPHRVHGLPSGAGPTPASVHQAAAQQTQNAAQERHLGVCGTLQCSHRSHRRRSAFVSPLPSPRGRRLRAGGGVSASNHADGVPSTAYTRGWSSVYASSGPAAKEMTYNSRRNGKQAGGAGRNLQTRRRAQKTFPGGSGTTITVVIVLFCLGSGPSSGACPSRACPT